MTNASDIDVIQEAFKIFSYSDVMGEHLGIFSDKLETLCLKMEYHQCKVHSSNNRLEKPQANKDVTSRWSFSQMDGLKELVPGIVKSINLKALFLCYGLLYGSDVIELFF
jgi:hypothetical protein